MKEYILKLGLTIVSLLMAIPSFAFDFEVDGIYYDVISLEDMTCEVTYKEFPDGYTDIFEYVGEIVIPSKVSYNSRVFSVIGIGYDAFKSNSSLTSVEIPNSVTNIGNNAFMLCKSLTSVKIPNSVTNFGWGVFDYCSSLTSVEIPNSVKTIKAFTFNYCSSLKSIIIPNSVTSIDDRAFSYCRSIRSIDLPNTITYLGFDVFMHCDSLESFNIPTSLNEFIQYRLIEHGNYKKEIENEIFSNCTNLTKLRINNSTDSLKIGYSYQSSYNDDKFIAGSYLSYKSAWGDWTSSLKELYIDRNISELIPVPELIKLEIGESMESVPIKNFPFIENLNIIYSYAQTPPTLPGISNKQALHTIVKVPKGALEAYKNAENWKDFWNLSALEEADEITEVKSNMPKEIIDRFDITGNKVDEYYDGLVIILFSDGSSKKIFQTKSMSL